MKAKDYRQLKKDAEERYQQALEKAKKDRVEALSAIEKVWEMMNPRRSKAVSVETSAPSQYGSLVLTVQKALELVPQRFNKNDVRAAMQEVSIEVANNCNQNSLSGCLHRLKRTGKIIEVKRGRGSKPTKYEKVAFSTSTEAHESIQEQTE